MKATVLGSLIGMAGILFAPVSLMAQSTPPEQIEAYVMVVKAEQAEKNGSPRESLGYFTNALALYQQVARDYPQWKPNLVRSRITDCQNHIERLRREIVTPAGIAVEVPPAIESIAHRDLAAERAAWLEEKSIFEQLIDDLEAERVLLLETNRLMTAEIARQAEETVSDQKKLYDAQEAFARKEKKWAAERQSITTKLNEALEYKNEASEAKRLKEENAALAQDRETLAAQLEQLTAKHGEVQQAADQLNNTLVGAEAEIDVLQQERIEMIARITDLEKMAEPLKNLEALEIEKNRLAEENAGLRSRGEEQSRRIEELQGESAASRTKELESLQLLQQERDRLLEQVVALKETVDFNQAEMKKIRELRAAIRELEKESKTKTSQLAVLQSKVDVSTSDDEKKRLKAQNAVMVEELQVFRSRLDASERRIRELERENASNRQQ